MASTSVSIPTVPPLITGPAIIGIVLDWFLYGILTMQYFMYVNNSGKDRSWLRIIVHILFILDSFQTFISMADMFYWFVYNFGNPSTMQELHYASIGGPFCYAIIACIVQIVYCWRMWVLARWRILPAILAFLSLVAVVDGIYVGIHATTCIISPLPFSTTNISQIYPYDLKISENRRHKHSSLLVSIVSNICRYYQARTSRSTMTAVKRILVLTVETNAVTSVLAVVLVALHLTPSLAAGKTNLFLTIGYILGKTYSNCFMVLLNQRIYYEQAKGRTLDGIQINTYTTTFTTTQSNNDLSTGRLPSSRDDDFGQISVIRFAKPTSSHPTADDKGGVDDAKSCHGMKSFPGEIV
ncbi:hypothetical protein D9756_010841 [Leucocoprinus leucothites]|uniref:DUF6534 domain-containing protein n=1 Tax=Leucocoprinus leucothites TaxID=201217 RepID=A0A8H5FR51_9AGAR|nr:hypothetical protein D9756_010841 [Leucoagaricus leucothites]